MPYYSTIDAGVVWWSSARHKLAHEDMAFKQLKGTGVNLLLFCKWNSKSSQEANNIVAGWLKRFKFAIDKIVNMCNLMVTLWYHLTNGHLS